MTVPSASRCSINLTNSVETSPAGGGGGTLSVDVARDCAWAATSGAPWVVITSAANGQGDASITYRVSANNETTARQTTIDVNSVKATIKQAAECRYRIAPLNAAVDAVGGTIAVDVQTDAACEWTAASDAGWIRLTGGTTGKGNGTVMLAVDATSGAARSGTIRVAGQAVTVTQGAQACTYRITPPGGTIAAAGGSATVTVSAGGHCPWTAASNAPWITIASGAAGTGGGSVKVDAAGNPGAGRTATATIATQTFTLTQAAAPCSFTFSPSAIDVPSVGGERTANVTTRADCTWTAAASVPWITVAAGSSAAGAGTVTFNIAPNSDDARGGAIIVGGQTLRVTQEAAPCTFAFSTASQTYDAAGGYGAVGIATRSTCSWTVVASSVGGWLVITDRGAGTGNGAVNFSVAVNSGPERTGSLTVGGQTFWVMQRPK